MMTQRLLDPTVALAGFQAPHDSPSAQEAEREPAKEPSPGAVADAWERFRHGDERVQAEARERLIMMFLPRADSVARRVRKRYWNGPPLDDLIGEARVALLTAIDTCGLGRELEFPGYAKTIVENHLKRWVAERNPIIYVPWERRRFLLLVQAAQDKLRISLKRAPSLAELRDQVARTTTSAAAPGPGPAPTTSTISINSIRRAIRDLGLVGAITPDPLTADLTPPDSPPPSHQEEGLIRRIDLQELLARCGLTDRELTIVDRAYFQDQTSRQIADAMGLTEINVRVILHRAVGKLRVCRPWRTSRTML
jgi:RNA polymerase sigma factor (sigma-70 family)